MEQEISLEKTNQRLLSEVSEKMPDPRIIFISGSGHSGSTLLDMLLGSHSQIVSLGEFGQFSRFFRDNDSCTCGATVHQCDFWIAVRQHLLSKSQKDLFAPPKDYHVSFMPGHRKLQSHPGKLTKWLYQQYLMAMGIVGNAALFRLGLKFFPAIPLGLNYNFKLFEAIAQVSDCAEVVDSSKSWLRMKLLYLWKPASVRVIYLVRDGRGVIFSHMRKANVTAREAAQRWARTQKMNLMMLRSIPEQHKFVLRYEDLTTDPNSKLAELCQWLGVSFEPGMLQFRSAIHHNLSGNRMRLGGEEKIVNHERWRNGLSSQDLQVFSRVAGRLNRYFGYDY